MPYDDDGRVQTVARAYFQGLLDAHTGCFLGLDEFRKHLSLHEILIDRKNWIILCNKMTQEFCPNIFEIPNSISSYTCINLCYEIEFQGIVMFRPHRIFANLKYDTNFISCEFLYFSSAQDMVMFTLMLP